MLRVHGCLEQVGRLSKWPTRMAEIKAAGCISPPGKEGEGYLQQLVVLLLQLGGSGGQGRGGPYPYPWPLVQPQHLVLQPLVLLLIKILLSIKAFCTPACLL